MACRRCRPAAYKLPHVVWIVDALEQIEQAKEPEVRK